MKHGSLVITAIVLIAALASVVVAVRVFGVDESPPAGPELSIESASISWADSNVGVSIPGSEEQVGEIRSDAVDYEIVLVNSGEEAARNMRFEFVVDDEIRELFGGENPFDISGNRQVTGAAGLTMAPGHSLSINQNVITRGYESEFAEDVEDPLTAEQAARFYEIADRVALKIETDTGSQTLDLTGTSLADLKTNSG